MLLDLRKAGLEIHAYHRDRYDTCSRPSLSGAHTDVDWLIHDFWNTSYLWQFMTEEDVCIKRDKISVQFRTEWIARDTVDGAIMCILTRSGIPPHERIVPCLMGELPPL